jgi:acyl-CoA synthetase (AMP-forming)/AMP-acid ligase II
VAVSALGLRPQALHVGAWLEEVAGRRPAHPALVDGALAQDWGSFARRLRQVGNALLALGLCRGDRVALLLPDGRAYLESDYGVMSAGLVRVPIDPRLPHADVRALLASSGARAVITTGAHDALTDSAPALKWVLCVGGAAGGALDFDAMVVAASDAPLPAHDPDDLATLNYSGGTTGAPKGIALSHRNLCTVLRHTAAAFAITPDAVFLNVRPLWPIAQVVAMAHLAAGATMVLGGRFDPAGFADQVRASGATRTSLVPTQLFRVLDHLQPDDPRLARLEAVYVGGSRVSAELFTRALATMGPRIGVLYGMTEAPISTYLAPAMVAQAAAAIATVGHPVNGCTLRVDGPAGPTNTPGEVGEVLIRGDHVMQGYWNNPSATAAALRDGWLRTGDLGRFDAAGRLSIVGRSKEVIRTGATSVVPAEVEDVLTAHPAVAEAAVVGLPDPEWGEAVTGFVVLRPGIVIDEATLLAHCKAHLAGFKCPRAIRFAAELPRSHYGKVLRAQLLAGIPR